MHPFFSIIIPTYNRSYILPKTIESVLAQTFSDWELIIVDDGSADNTKKVVTDIQDKRINYVYQDNAERSAARNNGLRHAKGQYICFLDSDDYYEPNHLEVLYSNILRNNSPVALFFVHACHYINQVKTIPEMLSLGGDPILYFFTQPLIPARVCVHNEILKTTNFDEDIVIVEDLVLWVKIAFSYSVYEIKEYTVRYTVSADNSVNLKNNCFLIRYAGLRIFFSRYPDIMRKIPSVIKRRVISDTLFGIARHYTYLKKYWKMVRYLCLSIGYCPQHEQTKAKIHMILFPGKHKYHD